VLQNLGPFSSQKPDLGVWEYGSVEAIIREVNVHRKTAERYLAEIAEEAGLVAVSLPGKGAPVAYRLPEAPPLPGEPEPSETPTLHAPATPKWENPDAHRETFRSTPLLLNGAGAPKSEVEVEVEL
jgi:hypothetical protein